MTTIDPKVSNKDSNKKSYFWVFVIFFLYAVSLSMAIPATPAMILNITNNDNSLASFYNGVALCLRYSLEFFSSPVLGTVSDLKGRKPVLIYSFITSGLQLFLFGLAPSIAMLIISSAFAGLGDVAGTTVYSIVTDIAKYNGDNVAQQYGLIGASFGLAVIIGPITGGIIANYTIRLCLMISACFSFVAAIGTAVLLEETRVPSEKEYSPKTVSHNSTKAQSGQEFFPVSTDDNPISTHGSSVTNSDYCQFDKSDIESLKPKRQCNFIDTVITASMSIKQSLQHAVASLKGHFAIKNLRELTVPYAISSVASSSMFVIFLYLEYRFHISPAEIGLFISFYGIIAAIIMGLCMRKIVPGIWDERSAVVYALIFTIIKTFGIGLLPYWWLMFVIFPFLSAEFLYEPTLKSLLIEESLKQEGLEQQGNLQGVLNSVRTLSSAVGSILMSVLFSIGIGIDHPFEMPYLPFLVSAALYTVALVLLRKLFSEISIDARRSRSIAEDQVV